MTPIRQLIKSLLVFKAINQIAILEADNLDGTPFFDKKMNECLQKIIGQLEICMQKNYELVQAEEVQQGMIQMTKFLEKWSDGVTSLNEDQLMDLDNLLEIFFHNTRNSKSIIPNQRVDDLNDLQKMYRSC